jgi:hypothetical protein
MHRCDALADGRAIRLAHFVSPDQEAVADQFFRHELRSDLQLHAVRPLG